MSGTYKLTVAYDGTQFAGWQVQADQPSVQGLLQDALAKLTGDRVSVIGSGRTDAGVHAIAQVASVRLPTWRHPPENLVRAINMHLPDTVAVVEASVAAPNFHAIRDAIGKRYRYQLQIGGHRSAFDFRYRWHLHTPIDLEAMRLAASKIVGRQDFASFQASGSDRKSTVRDVRACDIIVQPTTTEDVTHVAIEVEADGFLYNMVRNIVGTLVSVGRGQHSAEWVGEVIAARDRKVAGPTAPANGLFLLRVDYDPAI